MARPSSANITHWCDYLEQLLQKAREACGSGDRAAVTAVWTELYTFDEDSPKGAGLLDRIALAAASDLLLGDLERTIEALKKRDIEFSEVYALIKAATLAAVKK